MYVTIESTPGAVTSRINRIIFPKNRKFVEIRPFMSSAI